MPSQRTPPPCLRCGTSYHDFRTGLTFAQVRRMMFRGSPDDPSTWRQKRRRGVLGHWREIKISMWYSEHGGCEKND